MLTNLLKPLIDDAYQRGYSAGVTAEKLVKSKETADREYDLLKRGIEIGRNEILDLLGNESIEEISTEDFEELAGITKEEPQPFGFVGTIDDIGLILDEAN